MSRSREEILQDVLELLQELAQDWDYSATVDEDTRIFGDLGFESLDAVVLGTAIQEHYKQQMPFAGLLADVGQREVRDLSVAELVDFIDGQLDSTQEASS